MFRRRRIASRVRSRRNLRQMGVRSYSARGATGFVQPRIVRTPRVERAKFLDLNWFAPTYTNYYDDVPLIACNNEFAMNPASQGTLNKRFLNLVINGSNNNDRVSARIMMKSLYLRGTIFYNPIVDQNSPYYTLYSGGYTRLPSGGDPIKVDGAVFDRSVTIFIVYYPRVALVGAPSWNSLLETPISTYSGMDETNIFGARILLRKSFRLSLDAHPTAMSVGRNSRRDFAWKLNLNLPAEWTNTPASGPSAENMRSGQLMIMCLSNTPGASSSPYNSLNATVPKVHLRSRLAFCDA